MVRCCQDNLRWFFSRGQVNEQTASASGGVLSLHLACARLAWLVGKGGARGCAAVEEYLIDTRGTSASGGLLS